MLTVITLPSYHDNNGGSKSTRFLVQEMVSKVDINNDGIIDICEFIRMMSLQQNPLITPESQLEDIFRIFDKDGSGFITRV